MKSFSVNKKCCPFQSAERVDSAGIVPSFRDIDVRCLTKSHGKFYFLLIYS